MNISDALGCSNDCLYFGKSWPSHKPTPLCRLIKKFNSTNNPVTKGVYRDMISKRISCGIKLNSEHD